jgi:hypothetical protein
MIRFVLEVGRWVATAGIGRADAEEPADESETPIEINHTGGRFEIDTEPLSPEGAVPDDEAWAAPSDPQYKGFGFTPGRW